jgi:hypothetical protein
MNGESRDKGKCEQMTAGQRQTETKQQQITPNNNTDQ